MSEYKIVTFIATGYNELYRLLQKLFDDKGVKQVEVHDIPDNAYEVVCEMDMTAAPKQETITPDEYQKLSRRTQNDSLSATDKRSHALFGLAAEVGEIHSLFQHDYQGKPVQKEKVLDECSDLCWFLCELLDTYNLDFSEVLQYNIEKLRKRYPDGFDAERSEKRHETE